MFVGAGDIAQCGALDPARATASLLDLIGGTVFTLGDNAYFQGSANDFNDCYDPTWGHHKGRTFATVGNHEYETFPGASPYYAYFGAAAGPTPGLGYYAYDVGDWRIISLNSNYRNGVPVDTRSAQYAWLVNELNTHTNKCTMALWHHPLFTSGPNLPNTDMRDFWNLLYSKGVDVVLNGHEHFYERFAPQDPNGRPDPAKGITEFIAGTGGAALYDFQTHAANSVRQYKGWGVLKMTLLTDSYSWEFIPVSGAIPDSGSASCH